MSWDAVPTRRLGEAGKNYRARSPTMLHTFLCLSVLSLFVGCTLRPSTSQATTGSLSAGSNPLSLALVGRTETDLKESPLHSSA